MCADERRICSYRCNIVVASSFDTKLGTTIGPGSSSWCRLLVTLSINCCDLRSKLPRNSFSQLTGQQHVQIRNAVNASVFRHSIVIICHEHEELKAKGIF